MSYSDVEIVLHDLGIEVLGEGQNKKTGETEWKARCPFHKGGTAFDHNPGWYINDSDGSHICFSCGFSGGLTVLVRDTLGMTWAEAEAWLNTRIDPIKRILDRQAWAPKEKRKPSAPVVPMTESRLLAMDEVPEEYLKQRHITRRAATAFGLHWDSKVSAWILPIRSPQGVLLGWQVKGVGPDRLFRNYPHGIQKSSTLFGYELLRGNDEVVVLESQLDAVRLHGLGYPAVSTMGAKVSEEQMRLLLGRSASLVWAMDNPRVDEAGRLSSLAVMGLDARGRDKGTDYSRLTRLSFYPYGDDDVKDPGDQTDREIHWSMNNLKHSVYREKALQ